jgi:hypothetical protein
MKTGGNTMKTIQSSGARHFTKEGRDRGCSALGLLLAAQVLAVGCGPAQEPHEPSAPTRQTQDIRILNGISANGISANGISANGISANGISANGLTTQGVNTADFTAWFQADPERNDTLMQYMARCGAKKGQRITYTDPVTARGYTWDGLLGLTPEWASGVVVTEAEQQVMTACLAAHVNRYGLHVSLSVLGQDSKGQPLDFSQEELETYSRPEGCFFGNLFTGEGFFVGTDGSGLEDSESSARACALTSSATSSACAPMAYVGACESLCTREGNTPYYTRCTLNGRQYLPLTTRLKPADVYACGDGVCQFTERCGTSTTPDSCQADCGACP